MQIDFIDEHNSRDVCEVRSSWADVGDVIKKVRDPPNERPEAVRKTSEWYLNASSFEKEYSCSLISPVNRKLSRLQ